MVKLSGNMLSILSGFFFLVELGHSFVNLSEGFQEPKRWRISNAVSALIV